MKTPDPTPAEIRKELERIQEGWSPVMRSKRLVGGNVDPRVGIMVVSTALLNPSISEELGNEAYGWNYLEGKDLRERSEPIKPTKPVLSEKCEELVAELYEAVVVQFGE